MAVLTGSSFFPRLERLKIEAFKDKGRTGIPKKEFRVMFNPETYSLSYKNNFSEHQALGGTKGRRLDFMSSEPSRFSLKLILDSTGVTGRSLESFTGLKNVHASVEKFLELTVATKSKEEPSYLTLVWGTLRLECRLSEVTVNYTLFDKQGNPLRAELDTTFIEDKQTRLEPAPDQNQVSGTSVQISNLTG